MISFLNSPLPCNVFIGFWGIGCRHVCGALFCLPCVLRIISANCRVRPLDSLRFWVWDMWWTDMKCNPFQTLWDREIYLSAQGLALFHGCVFTQQSCVCIEGLFRQRVCPHVMGPGTSGKPPKLPFCSLRGSGKGMEVNQNWASPISKSFSCLLLLLWILPISAPEQLWFCNSLSVMRRHWIIYNISLMSSRFHYILGLWKAAIAI